MPEELPGGCCGTVRPGGGGRVPPGERRAAAGAGAPPGGPRERRRGGGGPGNAGSPGAGPCSGAPRAAHAEKRTQRPAAVRAAVTSWTCGRTGGCGSAVRCAGGGAQRRPGRVVWREERGSRRSRAGGERGPGPVRPTVAQGCGPAGRTPLSGPGSLRLYTNRRPSGQRAPCPPGTDPAAPPGPAVAGLRHRSRDRRPRPPRTRPGQRCGPAARAGRRVAGRGVGAGAGIAPRAWS